MLNQKLKCLKTISVFKEGFEYFSDSRSYIDEKTKECFVLVREKKEDDMDVCYLINKKEILKHFEII